MKKIATLLFTIPNFKWKRTKQTWEEELDGYVETGIKHPAAGYDSIGEICIWNGVERKIWIGVERKIWIVCWATPILDNKKKTTPTYSVKVMKCLNKQGIEKLEQQLGMTIDNVISLHNLEKVV